MHVTSLSAHMPPTTPLGAPSAAGLSIGAQSFNSVLQSQLSDTLEKLTLPEDFRRILKDIDQKEHDSVVAQFSKVIEDRRLMQSGLEEKLQEYNDMLKNVHAQLGSAGPDDRARLAGLAEVLQRSINDLTKQINGIKEEINAVERVLAALGTGQSEPFAAMVALADARSLGTADSSERGARPSQQ